MCKHVYIHTINIRTFAKIHTICERNKHTPKNPTKPNFNAHCWHIGVKKEVRRRGKKKTELKLRTTSQTLKVQQDECMKMRRQLQNECELFCYLDVCARCWASRKLGLHVHLICFVFFLLHAPFPFLCLSIDFSVNLFPTTNLRWFCCCCTVFNVYINYAVCFTVVTFLMLFPWHACGNVDKYDSSVKYPIGKRRFTRTYEQIRWWTETENSFNSIVYVELSRLYSYLQSI